MNPAQALAILTALQALPKGAMIDLTHCQDNRWFIQYREKIAGEVQEHWGADLVDALGQLAQAQIK